MDHATAQEQKQVTSKEVLGSINLAPADNPTQFLLCLLEQSFCH